MPIFTVLVIVGAAEMEALLPRKAAAVVVVVVVVASHR